MKLIQIAIKNYFTNIGAETEINYREKCLLKTANSYIVKKLLKSDLPVYQMRR